MKGFCAVGLLALAVAGLQDETSIAGKVLVVPIVGEINYAQMAFLDRNVERALEEKPTLVLLEIDTPGGLVAATLPMCENLIRLKNAGIPTVAYIMRAESETWSASAAGSAGAFIAFSCQRIYMGPASVIGAAQPVSIGEGGEMKPAPKKVVSFLKTKMSAYAKENGHPENLAIAMVDPDHQVYRVIVEGRPKFISQEELDAPGFKYEEEALAVTKEGEPLTLSVDQAVSYGFAFRTESRDHILEAEGTGNAPVHVEAFTWSEDMVSIMTSPLVRSLLILIALVLGYMEIKTPGFGAFGFGSIICFTVVIFGQHAAGLADALDIALIIAGVVLIGVEIFVVPGTMVSAMLGFICIVAGLIMLMLPGSLPELDNPFSMSGLLDAAAEVILTFLAATGVFFVVIRFMRQIPGVNRLVLEAEIGEGAKAEASKVGRSGVVIARLSPGGKAEVDGEVIDVVTEGEFIEEGTRVRVVRVEGARTVVETAE